MSETKRTKTGGRQKGTSNLATILREQKSASFKAAVESHQIDPLKEIAELKHHLEPKEWAQVLVSLLPFLYPKLKSIEIKKENPFADMSKEELLNFSKEMTKFLGEV